jgi:predicted PurR-regulated permease PerM
MEVFMETETHQTQWPTPARYLAVILLFLGFFGILIFIKPVFDTVALGFIFAFLFYGPINWAGRRLKGKYGLSVILFYLLIIIVLVLAILIPLSYFANGMQGLFQDSYPEIDRLQLQTLIPESITVEIKDIALRLAQMLLDLISGLAGIIGLVVVALFFSALLLLNLHQARGSLTKWIPPKHQFDVRQILQNLDQVWVGYMKAQVIYGTVLAIGSWIEYTLFGVPYPFVMAVLTGVISLIPTIGGFIASLIVAIPCLLLGSTVFTDISNFTFTILVFAINVLITQISYNFFALPIIGKFVRLPVAAVLIGVLAGMALGNILLAFLIVPILSTLTILGSYLLSKITGQEYFSGTPADSGKDSGFFSQILSTTEATEPIEAETQLK